MSLVRSVQALGATLLALARTRLELASVESQELLARLVAVIAGAVAAILLGALALGFGAVALVMWAPPEQRAALAAGLALVFLLAAGWLAWRVWREARVRPFAATLAVLEEDGKALEPRE